MEINNRYSSDRIDRAEDGTFYHPDLPSWPNESEDTLLPLLHAQGYVAHIIMGDSTEAFSDEAIEEGGDSYWAAMRSWQPDSPEGDGWLLAAIADSEDGPQAWFVRPMTGDEFHNALACRHPDDVAVDELAAAMKLKLRRVREKGRGGWKDRQQCTGQQLSDMLRANVDKGDPVDVANFCMFLQQRGEPIAAVAQTGVPDLFVEWLEREMPKGTIIGRPAWWAPKIARALRNAERGVLGGCNG
ncbi:hypothetical protein ACI6Q5_05310 [Xanthomonas codiaei]|uniref:Uncharacterized protein n=1 Tax=Xanthomonas codiaei TaxID=56463 RepID=A0ABW9MJT0_9XANT|nr:hypothetical protein [Xanthomonas codiaei]